MSFNFPRQTLLPVSIITLSLLSGCSNIDLGNNSKAIVKAADPYNNYYDSKKVNNSEVYRPKIKRTYTKAIFKTTAPKRYVVKNGDTLWKISNMFLNNSSYWPEIWDVNQKVRNPHLIFPGDVLHIYEGGKRRVKVSDGSYTEKLVPQMRIDRKGGGEPISTLAPFFAWPKVVDKDTIDKAPYIVGAQDASMLLEKGKTVYSRLNNNRNRYQRYAIFHKAKELVDPLTNESYGYQIDYNGLMDTSNVPVVSDILTGSISYSRREIKMGDILLPADSGNQSLDAPISTPKDKVRGTIISLVDASMISGDSMIITINQGAKHGITVGNTVAVYAPGKTVNDPIRKTDAKYLWETAVPITVDLPPTHVATAIIYKVLNNISYALVSESEHAVKEGYKVTNP